jgi:hypothetical protein
MKWLHALPSTLKLSSKFFHRDAEVSGKMETISSTKNCQKRVLSFWAQSKSGWPDEFVKTPKNIFVQINTFIHWKKWPKDWAVNVCNFQKNCPKVNNGPIGENSPNKVTLLFICSNNGLAERLKEQSENSNRLIKKTCMPAKVEQENNKQTNTHTNKRTHTQTNIHTFKHSNIRTNKQKNYK